MLPFNQEPIDWLVSTNQRSIDKPVASLPWLLHMQILLQFFNATFLSAKSTRFWCLKGSFSTSWSVIGWFRHEGLFLGRPRLLRNVISLRLNFSASGPCPILLRNEKLQGNAYDKRCQRRVYKKSNWPKNKNVQTIDYVKDVFVSLRSKTRAVATRVLGTSDIVKLTYWVWATCA